MRVILSLTKKLGHLSHLRFVLVIIIFALICGSTASTKENSGDSGLIADQGLENAIREALGKPSGELTARDLADISVLSVSFGEIIDLTGIQVCVNITSISLCGAFDISRLNPFTGPDLNPLMNLNHLTQLDLSQNFLGNIQPLGNLTGLNTLKLSMCMLTDLGPLSSLSNLTSLDVSYNDIMFSDELAELVNLQILDLSNNPFIIAPPCDLTGLQELRELNLESTSDLLAGYDIPVGVTHLDASDNNIEDCSLLSTLTCLLTLDLSDNLIQDLTNLAGLTNLEILDLSNNRIRDINPLVQNTGLGSGDVVLLLGNPLPDLAIERDVPILRDRGVDVRY